MEPENLVIGTDGDETLVGTAADDLIVTGNATPNGDVVVGSVGNDTIDMSGNDGVNGFLTISYGSIVGPINVSIDGGANTGIVDKGGDGIDTLIDVENPLNAGWFNGGLSIVGSSGNDSFDLTLQGDQWISVRGEDGVDSYNISGTGLVRLDFRSGNGVNANLASGQILDDGFGNTETFTGNVWELTAGNAADVMIGSNANESFRPGGGNDIIDGAGGFDRLRYDFSNVDEVNGNLATGLVIGASGGVSFTDSFSNIEWLRGSEGNDTLTGNDEANRLEGNASNDLLIGGLGDDTLDGGGGNDTLDGGVGNDQLIGGAGSDLIRTGDNDSNFGDFVQGGSGNDTVDFGDLVDGFVTLNYNGLAGPITVTIDGAANTGSINKGAQGVDTMIDVENPLLSGWTTGGLHINGTSSDDVFNVRPAGPQWMSIRGGDGVDTYIINGSGDVRLRADDEIGQVRLDMRGGDGIDVNLATRSIADDGFGNAETIGGTAPVWEVLGSSGDDVFVGSNNAESYRYEGGNNSLDGSTGFDRLRYDTSSVASVEIDAAAGIATIQSSDGGTFTDTFTGFEWFRGSNGADRIVGNSDDNRFEGRAGDDTIEGGAGEDTAVLFVARADAEVSEVEGGIRIVSAEGTDIFRSIEFFQFVIGVDFEGAETISASALLEPKPDPTGDVLLGTDSDDTLTGSANDDTIAGGDGDDSIEAGGGNDNISASDGNDFVDGGPGNDSIGGGLGNDTIFGGDGDDVMGAGFGDDSVSGGLGNDVVAGGAGNDTLDGGDGNDSMSGSFGNDLIDAGSGADDIGGGTGRDTIDAGTGNDRVGGGEGDDSILGGDGNDFLAGGGRNDTIDGGTGNDTINAGAGNDVMTGGAGADQFVFSAFFDGEADVITDFEDGIDRFFIRLVNPDTGETNITNGNAGLQGFVAALNITDTATGAQLNVNGNTILVEGIASANLTVDDFQFL